MILGGVAIQEDIRFPAHDERPMRASLALPSAGGPPRPAVIVLHEIYGLNDDIRRIAARFADEGYVALAPDLYDGRGPRLLCIARTLRALMSGRGPAFLDLEAARLWLCKRPEVDESKIGVVGFCMGGGFATLFAVRAPLDVAAPFYGATPKSVEALMGICPVVASYGDQDRFFVPQAQRLGRHLEELGVPHDLKLYPGVGHSFMNEQSGLMAKVMAKGPMTVGYNEAAAEDAWRRMLTFFAEHLEGARE